jgi:hypothetical protein
LKERQLLWVSFFQRLKRVPLGYGSVNVLFGDPLELQRLKTKIKLQLTDLEVGAVRVWIEDADWMLDASSAGVQQVLVKQ